MNREQRRKMAQSQAKSTKGKTDKYIDLSKLRAKANGEVFTPPLLVEEMLDLLKDDFSNRNLTFFDPCFGATAVFHIMLLFRLADGLRTSIPNPKERIRHIMENMIYGVEKDPDAFEFGAAIMQKYAHILSAFLCLRDAPDTVQSIRGKYIQHYDGIIETFYESIKKKSA